MLENGVLLLAASRENSNDIPIFNYVVGEDALLSCDHVDADWAYVNLSTLIIPRDIASSGQVVFKWVAKYSIEKTADGLSPLGLTVKHAGYDDAGLYSCSKALKDFRYVHLVITGSFEQFLYLNNLNSSRTSRYVVSIIFHLFVL